MKWKRLDFDTAEATTHNNQKSALKAPGGGGSWSTADRKTWWYGRKRDLFIMVWPDDEAIPLEVQDHGYNKENWK